MRRALLVCFLLVACDKTSSSETPKPTPSAPAPSGSTAVVNAKIGCRAETDGGNAIGGSTPNGHLTMTASRGKAQLVVGGTQRVVLDGDGKPEGQLAPVGEEGDKGDKLAITLGPAPNEASVHAGGKKATAKLDLPAHGETFDAVTAAAGKTWAAVAWRATKGDTTEIRVARFGADGKKEASTVLVKGNVGAPTLAFEGDALHAIWPERANDKAPYRLRWVKWFGKGAPSEVQILSTRGGSATQPALAIEENGYFVIAWTDETDGKTAVKAGSSKVSLLHATTNADDVLDKTGAAHEPAVAVDGRKAWIAWKDDKGVRATALKCIE